MIELVTLCYVIAASTYLLILTRGRWLLNPAPLWVLVQLIFFLGTLQFINLSIRADVIYLFTVFGGLFFFIVGTLVVDFGFSTSRKQAKKWHSAPIYIEHSPTFDHLITIIITISVAVSVMYYYTIGYNIFLEGVFSLLRGEALKDVATLRLETYAGSQYFAPGYVNQFKNVLLPILTGYFYARYILSLKRKRIIWPLIWILVLSNIVFLLGTGQRGPFAYAFLIILAFFNATLPRKKVHRVNIALFVSFVTIFSIATIILRRGGLDQFWNINESGVLIAQLLKRIFCDNQFGGVLGFRYIFEMPVQYGAEWIYSLQNLLPGRGGIGIASEVFELLFGSLRGTTPLSIWGSLWYNFGIFGPIVFPFFLGLLYQGLYFRLIRGPKTLFRLLCYSAICIYLGMWFASGPDYLIRYGVLTIVILRMIMAAWLRVTRVILRKSSNVKRVDSTSRSDGFQQ